MDYFNNDDPTSYSRPDLHKIKHIKFSLDVDFKKKILKGSVNLSVEKIQDTDDLILDIRNLVILNVSLASGEDLDYTIGEHVNEIGSMLTVHLPVSVGLSYEVHIEYETSPAASGLQWLDPPQTAGRNHPYLFSQCQGIHARSIFPCQDTSNVKFTYAATVTAPPEFTVLMSALHQGSATEPNGKSKKHSFSQPVPIPSYILALCVGMLESRILGPRSTIWSEKEIIEESAWEFANADIMLKAAEKMCGPYQWGIYDVLVLPPSCAYGGMENACLTFVTPTCLAGDRSLEEVIVHEILHSWTGNLVTCSNLEHLWLNEGFTMFLERKISALLKGESPHDCKYRDFLSIMGLAELKDSVYLHWGVDNPLTKMVVDLKRLNPDDSYSVVPYEKGYTFLVYLERLLGGPDVFEPFIRAYINHFQRQSIKSEDFKGFLLQYFKDDANIKEIDWNGWFYNTGMPLQIPKYDTTMSEACTNLANNWTSADGDYSTFSISDIKNLDPQQQRQFVGELLEEDNVSLEMVKAMEEIYKMDSIRNSEIKYRWLRLCIKARWTDKVRDALDFVNSQGRMKFVRPVYRDLYAWEAVRNQALENFQNNKKYMMHILEYTVKKDLNLDI